MHDDGWSNDLTAGKHLIVFVGMQNRSARKSEMLILQMLAQDTWVRWSIKVQQFNRN